MFLDDYLAAIEAFKNSYGLYSMCIYDIRCSSDGTYIIFTDGSSKSYYYHIKNRTLRTREVEFAWAWNY